MKVAGRWFLSCGWVLIILWIVAVPPCWAEEEQQQQQNNNNELYYADHRFTCPVQTTCPIVCVPDVANDCPTACPEGTVLCGNQGKCAAYCNDDNEQQQQQQQQQRIHQKKNTPCPCSHLTACPAVVVDDYEYCNLWYGTYYDDAEAYCEQVHAETRLQQVKPWHVLPLCTAWLAILSVALGGWARWRNEQVTRRERESTTHPQNYAWPDRTTPTNHNEASTTTTSTATTTTPLHIPFQQGWRPSRWGTCLYAATVATNIAWSVLLAWLTWQYYLLEQEPSSNNNNDNNNNDSSPSSSISWFAFASQQAVLRVFIPIWCFGLVWNLCWNGNALRLHFMAPCSLQDATYVTIQPDPPPPLSAASIPALLSASSSLSGAAASSIKKPLTKQRPLSPLLPTVVQKIVQRLRQRAQAPTLCRVYTLGTMRFLSFQLQRFAYDSRRGMFTPALWHGSLLPTTTLSTTNPSTSSPSTAQSQSQHWGLSSAQVYERWQAVGSNTIDMEEPYFGTALAEELAQPFYTYQLYMVWSWCPLDYYYMAMVWAIVISTSAVAVAWFHFRNQRNLFRLAATHGSVRACRNGVWTNLSPSELVPGDVVQLHGLDEDHAVVPCDLILIQGGPCLMDESALTGESYPQVKKAMEDISTGLAASDADNVHSRHVLAAGTSVLQHDADNLAVVWRTGSSTSKGALLQSVVSFERDTFSFDVEVVVVLGILLMYAILCFAVVVSLIKDKPVYGWFYGVYVVGTILPPLLPTVFTVSVGISDDRLAREKRVATAHSESILIAGKVTRAFFDKTGTLTKQGLDFLDARSLENSSAQEARLRQAMVVCHSLTPSTSQELIGNPVDHAMFHASGGTLVSSKTSGSTITVKDADGNSYTIIRHFEFDHERMTQSVLVQVKGDENDSNNASFFIMTKGSGESVQRLCRPETVPSNFDQELLESAKAGIYQISVACKDLPSDMTPDDLSKMSRDELEVDLDFVGVLDFQNVLRPETPDVIRELALGGIVSSMVTGDAVNTGIRIALEARIFDKDKDILVGSLEDQGHLTWVTESNHQTVLLPSKETLSRGQVQLAMSGAAWAHLLEQDADMAATVAPWVRVFGRCTPHDKVTVIRTMVDLGHVTLMCGDGGNDTGALKAAHVGVALSEAEASMVAPFASLDKDIRSVLDVLKEGRCALASALASYKYMIMYGQVETINQIVNAYYQITFSSWCWVLMDGIWTITMAFTLPLAKPAAVLSDTRPTSSILGLHTLSSALGVLAINFAFTVAALMTMSHQDWYQCRQWDSTDVSNADVIGDNYESEVIFLVTGFQYISSAMAYNFGYEFRQAWWRNTSFVLAVAIFGFFHYYAALVPSRISCIWRVNCEYENAVGSVTSWTTPMPIQNHFHTTLMPVDFRWKLVILMVLNTMATMGYEYFVVNGIRRRMGRQNSSSRLGAKIIEKDGFQAIPAHDGISV